MTKRLDSICSLIRSEVGIADVGTDHGMIPVHFALAGYPGKLFASDVNTLPLRSARTLAEQEGVADRISFHCADGLDFCRPEDVDAIVLAGMGGDLIVTILNRAEWVFDARVQLVLQPMTKQEILRFWLVNNGFSIEEERLVKEAGKCFILFSARYSGRNSRYSDAELFTGKRKQARDPALFCEVLQREAQKVKRRRDGLRLDGNASAEARFYDAICRELESMGEEYDDSK